MRTELVTQPDASSGNLYEYLVGLLADPSITRFVAVTAWVNHRGLARLLPALRAFRGRPGTPGTAEIIVGIDEGGATEQGLRLAAAEFDRSSVLFTTDDRTFHPKLYVGLGPAAFRLYVGSNNLTPGGLFFNFEVGLSIEATPGATASDVDQGLVRSVTEYIERLYRDGDVCKPLVPNLEAIISDPIYRVRDETAQRGRSGRIVVDPDADGGAPQRPPLFGRSAVAPKARVPSPGPIPPPRLAGPLAPATANARVPTRQAFSVVRRRWFKTLPASAAQHSPGPNSRVTGNLRLGQAGHGLDQTMYFRHEFFDGLAWTGTLQARGIRENAWVPMEVVIDGRMLGVLDFEVSHADWREAGQGNVTTFLHLSPISGDLRSTDYTGRVITLEQSASGGYRLVIDAVETGPFVR